MTNLEGLEKDIAELNKIGSSPNLVMNNMLKSIALSLAKMADKTERPRGIWIKRDGVFVCSCCQIGCSEQPTITSGSGKEIPTFDFCPYCGAEIGTWGWKNDVKN